MLDLLTNLFLFFDTLSALMRIKVLRFYRRRAGVNSHGLGMHSNSDVEPTLSATQGIEC